ncbi:MAG: hypothetical protein AB7V22_12235 [Kiritimatiellia bacterium]
MKTKGLATTQPISAGAPAGRRPNPSPGPWPRRILKFAVLALLAGLPYLPTLRHDFLPTWDDGVYVLQNYRVHQLNWGNVVDVFRLHPQRGRMPNAQFTPLVELSFMLETRLFGLAPGMFHLTNVLLHGLNVLLVFLFLRRLAGNANWAWLAAAFFAVHPLHVESVAWVAERKDLLSAFFYLLALTIHLRRREDGDSRNEWALAGAGLAAFLSKPLAVTLPAACLLCDYYRHGRVDRKAVVRLWPLWTLSAVGIGITLYTHLATGVAQGHDVLALGSNLLIAARGIALYAEKFVWPFGLSAFYPVPEPGQPFGLSYYVALAAVAAVLGGVAWLAIHGRGRAVVFGALFFLVVLSPSSRLVPVGMRFLAADRFFYLPGIGFFLLLAGGVQRLMQGRPAARWGGLGLAVALGLLWGGATWRRCQVWSDDETLWRDTLAKYPSSAYVLGGLAQAVAARDPEEAGRYADAALAISSRDGQTMLVKAFQTQQAGQSEASLAWLAQAEAKGVHPAYVALMVGRTYSLSGDPEKALLAYARVVALEPRSTEYLGWMAFSWLALGDEAAALECLMKVREIDGALARRARLPADRAPRPLSPLQQAFCLRTDWMRFQYELAQHSQFVLKDNARARREYRLLLDYYPAVVDVWQSVAAQVPRRRWPAQVREVQETHVRKLAVAFYNYACLLAESGDAAEALAAIRSAIAYDPALKDNAWTDPDLAGLREMPDFIELARPSVVR